MVGLLSADPHRNVVSDARLCLPPCVGPATPPRVGPAAPPCVGPAWALPGFRRPQQSWWSLPLSRRLGNLVWVAGALSLRVGDQVNEEVLERVPHPGVARLRAPVSGQLREAGIWPECPGTTVLSDEMLEELLASWRGVAAPRPLSADPFPRPDSSSSLRSSKGVTPGPPGHTRLQPGPMQMGGTLLPPLLITLLPTLLVIRLCAPLLPRPREVCTESQPCTGPGAAPS